MYSSIIFDLDGVIIDSEPIYMEIEQDLFNEIGIEISHEEHLKFAGRSDLWKVLKKQYDLDIDIREIHEKENSRYVEIIEHSFNKGPIEGASDTIKNLHENGNTLVLASSSEMKNIELVLSKFNLLDYFKLRISGADLETSKPHPEIFEKAALLADSDPRECLVIEDSYNGVMAAKSAGMKCVGFLNPNSGNQDLSAADWIIKSFTEFKLERFIV